MGILDRDSTGCSCVFSPRLCFGTSSRGSDLGQQCVIVETFSFRIFFVGSSPTRARLFLCMVQQSCGRETAQQSRSADPFYVPPPFRPLSAHTHSQSLQPRQRREHFRSVSFFSTTLCAEGRQDIEPKQRIFEALCFSFSGRRYSRC